MTAFSMKAVRAVAPYALSISALVPAALPSRGLDEALRQSSQAFTGHELADDLAKVWTDQGWPSSDEVGGNRRLSEIDYGWLVERSFDPDFTVSEEAYGAVELVAPTLVLEGDAITHTFDDYDRAAMDLLAE